MVFQNDILAGSSGGTGTSSAVYKIDQSIRFNDDDNPYLSRTLSTSSDGGKTYTFSWWQKLGSKIGATSVSNQYIIHTDLGGGSLADFLYIYDDKFLFWQQPTGTMLRTNQVFRDTAGWYNITFAYDSAQAIASERIRLYLNGNRITSFSTENYPSLNNTSYFNTNTTHYIGGANNSGLRFDGYLAEIHFLDGYAYDPSYFGLFNDSGIWIPKEYSGSYGTNGFHIKGESASDLGNDSSGNNNDFTTSGLASHDQVSDSPTNNWCVMNPLNGDGGTTWKNGNLELATVNSGNNASTIFMTTGKWYWEVKGQGYAGAVCSIDKGAYNSGITPSDSGSIGYYSTGDFYWAGGSDSTPASYASSDIIGVAVNMDDGNISFYKNNTLQGTLSFSSTVSSLATDGCYACVNNGTSSSTITFYLNFGQDGTFAGTETAQGNSDGNGVGNFYYTPPSGYLALCTSNLGS